MKSTSKRTLVYSTLIAIAGSGVAACGGGGGGGGRQAGALPNAHLRVVGATAFSYEAEHGSAGQVSATDPTNDALTFSVAANPPSGTLVNFSPNGAFVYRPAPGFLGDDSFRVQVNDAAGNSVPAVVNINIPSESCSVAANDALRADGAALANIAVLANDTRCGFRSAHCDD